MAGLKQGFNRYGTLALRQEQRAFGCVTARHEAVLPAGESADRTDKIDKTGSERRDQKRKAAAGDLKPDGSYPRMRKCSGAGSIAHSARPLQATARHRSPGRPEIRSTWDPTGAEWALPTLEGSWVRPEASAVCREDVTSESWSPEVRKTVHDRSGPGIPSGLKPHR